MASITPRRNADGRITSWRVQLRRPDAPARYASAKTRAEAQIIARRFEREFDTGVTAAVVEMTISELIVRMVEDAGGWACLPASKRTSLNHIDRGLGAIRTGRLATKDVVGFARARHANKGGRVLSPATVAMDLGYLRDLLDYGAHHEGTAHRMTEVTLARRALRKQGLIGKSRIVSRLPTDAEFAAIIRACEENPRLEIPLAHTLRFLRATGLREGEALRVRWRDLDASRRVLLVPRRKHPKAPRDKELPLVAAHGIDPLKELQAIRDLGELRSSRQVMDDRILPFAGGSIGAAMRRACKAAGIHGVRLHDLRHDAITAHVRRRKLSLPHIMLISGHDDIHSLTRYTHLTAEDVIAACSE